MTSDFRPEVETRQFRACAMHPAIIIGTVRSLWTWLRGRYHVPQNVFLVLNADDFFLLNDIRALNISGRWIHLVNFDSGCRVFFS